MLYSFIFSLSPRHNIRCSKLQLCHNLIIVPHPAGWTQQLWDRDALLLYNNPSSLSLLSSSRLLFVYADELSKPCSLPPQLPSPLSGVTSLPFLLCKETKRALESIKNSALFGVVPTHKYRLKALRTRPLCPLSARAISGEPLKYSCFCDRNIKPGVRF